MPQGYPSGHPLCVSGPKPCCICHVLWTCMGTRSDLAPRGFCICVTVETRRSVNRQDYLSTCLTKLTGKRATAMTSESVKVIVRCRPMNDREEKLNCQVCACNCLCLCFLCAEWTELPSPLTKKSQFFISIVKSQLLLLHVNITRIEYIAFASTSGL